MDKSSGGTDHQRHAHYPLTDFLESGSARKLGELLTRLLEKQRAKRSKFEGDIGRGGGRERPIDAVGGGRPSRPLVKGTDGPPIHELLHELLDGVTLCRLHGSVIRGRKRHYAYDIGLNSDKIVGFVVPNPFDTVITFGRDRSDAPRPTKGVGLPPLDRYRVTSRVSPLADARETREEREPREPGSVRSGNTGKVTAAFPKRPEVTPDRGRERPGFARPEPTRPAVEQPPLCDLNVRLVVGENSALQTLQMHGPNVRIYFSTGLVRPVRKTQLGKYVPTGERQGVRLGDRTITLSRGMTPRLSAPLVFEDNLVQVGGQGVIAILKQVTLGGSAAKPKLIFDQTEVIF